MGRASLHIAYQFVLALAAIFRGLLLNCIPILLIVTVLLLFLNDLLAVLTLLVLINFDLFLLILVILYALGILDTFELLEDFYVLWRTLLR